MSNIIHTAASNNTEDAPITHEPLTSTVTELPAKKKMSGEVKLFIGILVGAVILGGAALYPMLMTLKPPIPPVKTGPVDHPETVNRAFLIPANSRFQGDPKAKYTLVEFSDYQCPSCKTANPMIAKALKEQNGKFNFVFRHFQAARAHRHSRSLGIAAEAAGMQGKFYEMGDKLFENQGKYEMAGPEEVNEVILECAKELKLDLAKFKKDLNSKEAKGRYDADQQAADKAGLNSTPSFFFVPPTGQVTRISTAADMAWWVADPKHYQ
jgi:protein-disulfide isomerase